jgi:SagB-type dehydrogenase family enzyme
MAAPVPVAVGRAYAFSHAYRREASREPVPAGAGNWGVLRVEGGERVALPVPAMGLLAAVDVAEAIGAGGPARPGAAAPGAPYLERLATLLYGSLGILRVDLNDPRGHAVHRAIPSASSLFPSELFVYVPRGAGAGEGIYHYDSVRHDLGLVRAENARRWLEAALDRSLEPFDAVLLVSSVLWRLVRKYSDFAYRLACLEAGHLVGNLLITSRALGWCGRVQYLFDDDLVEAGLGLPRLSVATMAAVLLSLPGRGESGGRSGTAGRGRGERPLAGRWRMGPGAREQAARSTGAFRMERASRSVRARPPAGPRPARDGSAPATTAAPPPAARGVGLLDAMRRRHSGTSGPNGVAVRPHEVSGKSVSRVLEAALAPYPSDLDGSTAPCQPRLRVFAVANRVAGLAPAAYRPGEDGVGLRRATRSAMPAGALWYRDSVDGRALGVIWALASDYDAAFATLGDRGYRVANLEAGVVAQRICLLVAGDRVFARPFCAFDERVLDRWLDLAWTGLTTSYLVLQGADRLPQLGFELPWVRRGAG